MTWHKSIEFKIILSVAVTTAVTSTMWCPVCRVVRSCVWVGGGGQPLKLRPVSESIVSPNSSDMLGWGWMNSATSSTVASQLTAR